MRDMKNLPVFSTLMAILIISMVLVTGCLDGERDSVMSRVTPTLSIHDQPSGYWIKVDPISDKQEGDIFTVNASTNLSVGEEIRVQISREGRYSKSQSGEYSGGQGTAKVMAEKDGNNSIFFVVNSSEFHLTPATYVFYEDAVNENASGWTRFNINERNTPVK
jgi:hypothetical protein